MIFQATERPERGAVPAERERRELKAYYYAQLNLDPVFRAALVALFDELDAMCPKAPELRVRSPGETEVTRALRWRHWFETIDEEAEVEIHSAFWGLGARWPLASDSRFDVRASWENREVLRDRLAVACRPEPENPLSSEMVWSEEQRRWEFFPPSWLPLVVPPTPAPFLYDPRMRDRAWLRAWTERIITATRRSLLEQAQRLEEQLTSEGYVLHRTPHRGNPSAMRRYARRLYFRAVKDWAWKEIAAATPGPRGVPASSSVQQQVKRWAVRLGVGRRQPFMTRIEDLGLAV